LFTGGLCWFISCIFRFGKYFAARPCDEDTAQESSRDCAPAGCVNHWSDKPAADNVFNDTPTKGGCRSCALRSAYLAAWRSLWKYLLANRSGDQRECAPGICQQHRYHWRLSCLYGALTHGVLSCVCSEA